MHANTFMAYSLAELNRSGMHSGAGLVHMPYARKSGKLPPACIRTHPCRPDTDCPRIDIDARFSPGPTMFASVLIQSQSCRLSCSEAASGWLVTVMCDAEKEVLRQAGACLRDCVATLAAEGNLELVELALEDSSCLNLGLRLQEAAAGNAEAAAAASCAAYMLGMVRHWTFHTDWQAFCALLVGAYC